MLDLIKMDFILKQNQVNTEFISSHVYTESGKNT